MLRTAARWQASQAPGERVGSVVRKPHAAALRRVLGVAGAVAVLTSASPSLAYRPFDSTDADVAHAGEVEIELGPLQWLREGSRRFVQAPAIIANVGLPHDRELVIEGRHEVALDREAG